MKSLCLTIVCSLACTSIASHAQTGAFKTERDRQNREAIRRLFPIVNAFDRPSSKETTSSALRENAASILPDQASQIQRVVNSFPPDDRIAADVRDSVSLLKALLETGACAKNSAAWNPLSRKMVEPRSYGAGFGDIHYTPRAFFKYHDDGSCLDVVRLTHWNKPANNALEVTAYYVSPQSGEAANQTYIIQKTVSEGWLIKNIGVRQ